MKIAPHLVPRSAAIAVTPHGIEPLLKNIDVPCRRRHVIRMARYALPKRLHVVNLLFDGKVVKTRWRNCNRLAHAHTVAERDNEAKLPPTLVLVGPTTFGSAARPALS